MGQQVSEFVITMQNPDAWSFRDATEVFICRGKKNKIIWVKSEFYLQGLRLPRDADSLKSKMKQGIALEVLSARIGYNDLPAYKKQIVKYSGSALIHGRPMDSVMVVMGGETGKGNVTTSFMVVFIT